MPRKYTELSKRCPRSFLFAIVANVGPEGASRSLAVAYRQGNDGNSSSIPSRVSHFVADTLALIEILSDPANRAPLEAERSLAEGWYRDEVECSDRPSVPDTPQPPFLVPEGYSWASQMHPQPELPWNGDSSHEFPFTATCLLLGLLRDNGDGNARTTRDNRSRLGDVQLQPLSTVFQGDCIEYGLVILDISNLDSGVKYGITAFPVRYMAEVHCRDCLGHWDPVEDPPPAKEPDVVPGQRPRELLSIHQWRTRYFSDRFMGDNPSVRRLGGMLLAGSASLNYICPLETYKPDPMFSAQEPQGMKLLWPNIYGKPPKDWSSDSEEDDDSTGSLSATILEEPPQKFSDEIASGLDDLLDLTQEPAEYSLEETIIHRIQSLAGHREQLRQRLEEAPDRLGPSKISSHLLRVAYVGHSHLNWVAFQKLTLGAIAAAIASEELREASALSLRTDHFMLARDENEGGLDDLIAALAQSTALKQLCFLQRPDRNSVDASDRFCSRLAERLSGGGLEWLRSRTMYLSFAFSTPLRSGISSTSSSASILSPAPSIHLFTFVGRPREDLPDAGGDFHHPSSQRNSSHSYSNYYAIDRTQSDIKLFAIRFLAYLRSLGLGSEPNKAILRFAYGGVLSSPATPTTTTTTTTGDLSNNPPPAWPRPDQLGTSPIPAGIFAIPPAPNDPSRVRLNDIPPGSWVVLVDSPEPTQKGPERPRPRPRPPPPPPPRSQRPADGPPPPPSLSNPKQPAGNMDPQSRSRGTSDDINVLQYSFFKIGQPSTEIAPEQQPQMPSLAPNSVKVVGALTAFLLETGTVSGPEISLWEKQVEEVESEIRTRLASMRTSGSRRFDIRAMPESSAQTLLNRLL
ncbi:hypothetical protein BJY04DRAFT_225153 [Aspergillus karnatakaensis]|uniref:uncharacterized protein n=1 Tax=Aspergillus karnatakaensis TaxID=1810916 RepID=UPI003CCE4A48